MNIHFLRHLCLELFSLKNRFWDGHLGIGGSGMLPGNLWKSKVEFERKESWTVIHLCKKCSPTKAKGPRRTSFLHGPTIEWNTHRERMYRDVLQRKDNSPNMMQLWTLITQHCQQLVKWVPVLSKGSGFSTVSATNFKLNQKTLPVWIPLASLPWYH